MESVYVQLYPARVQSPAKRQKGLHRVSSKKARETLVKIAVIAASGGLVASLAIPAYGFSVASDSTPHSDRTPKVVQTQARAVTSSAELALSRDGYTATKPAPVVAASLVNRFVTLNPPAQTYSGQAVVDFAMQFVGIVPYGMGNSPTTSFSCDGLTQYVFGKFGISLPRTANAQAARAVAISPADARPGDLLWYPGQHIGIYAGGGMMVDSGDWGQYVRYRAIFGNPVFMRLV